MKVDLTETSLKKVQGSSEYGTIICSTFLKNPALQLASSFAKEMCNKYFEGNLKKYLEANNPPRIEVLVLARIDGWDYRDILFKEA